MNNNNKRYEIVAGLVLSSGMALPEIRLRKSVKGEYEFDLHAVSKRVFNHKEILGSYRGHILILHTKDDVVIPVFNAILNFLWAVHVDVELPAYDDESSWENGKITQLLQPHLDPFLVHHEEIGDVYADADGRCTLVIFPIGGHNSVYSYNSVLYQREMGKFIAKC